MTIVVDITIERVDPKEPLHRIVRRRLVRPDNHLLFPRLKIIIRLRNLQILKQNRHRLMVMMMMMMRLRRISSRSISSSRAILASDGTRRAVTKQHGKSLLLQLPVKVLVYRTQRLDRRSQTAVSTRQRKRMMMMMIIVKTTHQISRRGK